jgi:two-component system, LuxR family, sensor kinase FixL
MKLNLLSKFIACAFWTFLSQAAVFAAIGAETPAAKRVLIISTGSRLAPGFAIVDQQLLRALGSMPSARIETYAENLDLVRFPHDRYKQVFGEYLKIKYSEFPPDLVILVFVGNLASPGELLPHIFPGTPIIVAGLTEEELRLDQFGTLISGVAQRADPRATLELILRLQPHVRRVVVIGGTADIDRHLLRRVNQAAESVKDRIEIDIWDNLSMADIRARITTLPADTAILFARLFRDGAGQAFISSQVGQSLAQHASVPVYIMSDASLGTGAIGGSVASIEAFGKRAGELARLILTGTAPGALPFEIRSDTVPMFDWRALQRWGISENRLPPDSIIRFRPHSFWEEYRWYIAGALVIMCLQTALIIDLLLQRRRRRSVEAQLQESQQLMELATTAGELGLWSRDLKNGDVWANVPMRSLFGFGAYDALRFEDMLARLHPEDRERMLYGSDRAHVAGAIFQGEFRTLLPDGKERWVLAKARSVADSEGLGEQRRMGVALDITERKRMEQALKEERSFLRQVLDIDPNFIFAKDRDGRFTLANKAVADAYGTTVEDLIGKTDTDFNSHREEVDSFRRADLEVIESLQEYFIPEERITDAQGKVRWLQTVKRPIIDSGGSASQVLGASTDITRRKQTELELQEQRAELAHVARVSIMGELAASLAHELNQPLTAILSNAQAALRFLSSKPADLEEVRETLQDIVKDNSRAGEVIRRIRALVKKEELEVASLDLAALVRDVVMLVHSDAILHNVRISVELDKGLPAVRGDRVQLQQVMLNILLNAFDAMKECRADDREVKLRAKQSDTGFIQVAVSDHGAGLSGDKLEKIFEPFYTTKGEGLGMGLSICRSIIQAHDGRLWAENNTNSGATFYFTVPVDPNKGNQARAKQDQCPGSKQISGDLKHHVRN